VTTDAAYLVREATTGDVAAMLDLFPRLASFDLPPARVPEHLWIHDEKLLKSWALGNEDSCLVHVAVDADGNLLGLVMTTLRPELLSHAPSAHLEAIVVSEDAQGKGIGGALVEATEAAAKARGALSITLHVFERNKRARKIYARAGYEEELIRCTKKLT